MNELTTIRKILERLTKYITKKKGYICQYCGHRSLQPYGGKCTQSKSGHHHYIAAEHWVGSIVTKKPKKQTIYL